MLANVEIADLKGLLTKAKRVQNRSPLPILKGVKIAADEGVFAIYATNLETTGIVWAPADIARDGTVVVDAATLAKVLAGYQGSAAKRLASLESDGADLKLHLGRSTVTLNGLPLEDWPRNDEPIEDVEPVHLPDSFTDALTRVMVAASGDDARPILCGVLFEEVEGQLRLVATDSYRLAWEDTDIPYSCDPKHTPLLPVVKGLSEVPRLTGRVQALFTEDGYTELDGPDGLVKLRHIEGTFPNYKQLIPDKGKARVSVTASLEEWMEALRPFRAFGDLPVRIVYASPGIDLRATGDDLGTVVSAVGVSDWWVNEDAEHPEEGEQLAAYNLTYLTEGLKVAGTTGEDITLAIETDLKPATLQAYGFNYLLMPIRT